MIAKAIQRMRQELAALSYFERLFIAAAMGCSLLVTMEASIMKAVSNSIFLTHYSAEWLPLAWLAVVPLNLVVVSLYNHFLPKIGCFKMIVASTVVAIIVSLIASKFISQIPGFPFLLYIWKDVYIMLMFQQVWSVFHSTISTKKAKYLYGIFYGIGGLGSVLGSLFPAFFAMRLGSEKLLLVAIPFYVCLMAVYGWMLKIREKHPEVQSIEFDQNKSSSFLTGVKTIAGSKLLIFIALTIVFMQLTSTLLDFKFNTYVAALYPLQDVRTAYLGRFFGMVNTISTGLQFLGTFLVIHLLGIRRTHIMIPLYLSICALGLLAFPAFALVMVTYGSIKAIDYSLFGVAKEMLYIPLKTEEKFQAKAVIDIFVYRSTKALASLVILIFEYINHQHFQSWISLIIFGLFIVWSLSSFSLYKGEPAQEKA